jgi:hypothetical protein
MKQTEDGATALRGGVGKHRKGDPTSDAALEHMLGFGQALENALKDAAATFYPDEQISSPRPFDVTVTFEATGNIRNPGVIDEYKAILTNHT